MKNTIIVQYFVMDAKPKFGASNSSEYIGDPVVSPRPPKKVRHLLYRSTWGSDEGKEQG
jgi:hypothetical protein